MPADKKKRVRNALKIDEISGVDVPAQEGAKRLIMKRAETPEDGGVDLKKYAPGPVVLTTSVEGHSHLIALKDYEGRSLVGGTTTYQDDHSHPWVMKADGTVIIGEADGHTHEAEVTSEALEIKIETAGEAGSVGKQEADPMPNDQKKSAEPTVEELTKQLERVTAIAGLNDAQKAHFNALDDAGKDAFLAKSAADRDAEIADVAKRAAEEDPVVYTTLDGVDIRKSAGDAVVAIAKSNDKLAKDNAELRKAAADAAIRKRAETELANLPGDLEARVSLLKAAESIEDEAERTAAVAALKAQNDALKGAFVTTGHGGGANADAENSAEAKLEALAKKHAEERSTTFEKAYGEVLETPEGQRLYGEMNQAAE